MTAELPHSPSADLPPLHRIRPERGRGVALAGLALLVLSTGLSGWVVLAIVGRFESLAADDPGGPPDPIGAVMGLNLVGMLATLGGGALTGMAVYGPGNRERWFFHLVWVVALLQLVTFPLGTLVGILLLFGLLTHRGEYQPGPGRAADASPGPDA